MNISEKITILRKRAGWSQEELSFRLDVSRQAVSKWESGGAIPDIDKIIAMSTLFNVSTDALLKDDGDTSIFQDATTDGEQQARAVSETEAYDYINMSKKQSPRIAVATALCMLAPICLMILGALSEVAESGITEGIAIAFGMSALLIFVAAAVAVFIFSGMAFSKYEYLNKDKIILSSDLKNKLTEEKQDYEHKYIVALTVATVICILSVLPLMIAAAFDPADIVFVICICGLLTVDSVAVGIFIVFGNKHAAYKKLLEEGEYSARNKSKWNSQEVISGAYWSVAVAAYLLWSFISGAWQTTWIIWPIAGVLYGAICAVIGAITHKSIK